MNTWLETRWYTVHTKPSQEDQAATNIRRMGLEVLLPKVRKEKRVWGDVKVVTKPLFPSYLFAQFCPAEYMHMIKYARGVRKVVSAGVAPLPVYDDIIQAIRSRIGEDGFIRMDSPALRPNERVVIQGGPLEGLNGVFKDELSDSHRVVILLQAVGYQARIQIDRQFVKSAVEA